MWRRANYGYGIQENGMMGDWVDVCALVDIEEEDVLRFEHQGDIYLAARDDGESVFVVDGLCTHERVELSEGFVFGCVLECPRHQGRFDLRDGRTCGGPVTEHLKTYPCRVEDGRVKARLGS